MTNQLIKVIVFILAATGFIVSCASQEDTIYLNNQLNAIQRQTKNDSMEFQKTINDLKESIRASESKPRETEIALKKDQESLRLSFAQVEADMEEIKNIVRKLTGKVEESRHLMKGAIEVDTTKEDSMVSQIKELLHMVEGLRSRVLKIENSYALSGSADKKEAGKKRTQPAPDKKQKQPIASEKKSQTEPDIYNATLGYYKSGSYEKAIDGFKEFLKLYPKSSLADNANFWVGECHRALKNYEEAILAYQKVIDGYPKGNKVPAAMLKQAVSFEKINDKTTAKLLFKKLIKKYPKSKEAETARKRLK